MQEDHPRFPSQWAVDIRLRPNHWIPLRRLKDHPSVESFLENEVFRKAAHGSDLQKILEETFNNPEDNRSLFILDGLDEIIGYQRPGGSLVDCISDLFNRKHLIVTSRPHAALPTNIDSYDLEVETVGFHDREIASYVENVNPSQRAEIINFIEKHWAMKGLMRIPIQLDALCFTWSEDLFNERPITTMTGLYSKIEMKLHRKDMARMGKTVNGQVVNEHTAARLITHRQIYKVMKSPIDLVRFMAFFGMYHSLTEFTSRMRSNIHDAVGDTTDIDLDHISFLRSSDASIAHQDREYYFLHLTFQEYFAAQHFVYCWKNGLKIPTLGRKSAKLHEVDPDEFLACEKYNGRYNVMWRFVTGILEIEDNGEENFLLKFLKQTEEEQRDLLGTSHLHFVMHCFSEISQKQKNIQLADLWKYTCTELLRLLLSDCRYHTWAFSGLGMEMEFPERVLVLLFKGGSSLDKTHFANIISHRRFLSPETCNAVVEAFNLSEDAMVRRRLAILIGTHRQFSSQFVIDTIRRSEPDMVNELLTGLQRRQDLPSLTVEEIFFSAARDDAAVCDHREKFLAKQHHLPEKIIQEMTSGLTGTSVADRLRALRFLRNPSLPHRDFLHCVIRDFNKHIGTDTEERLQFLLAHPSLPPRVVQEITERMEDMTIVEIERLVSLLKENQPLEARIVNRLWVIVEIKTSSMEARCQACKILRNQNALSNTECLSRFLACQQKDEFAMAITCSSFEKGLCPPEPLLNHAIAMLSKLDSGYESATMFGSRIPTSFYDTIFMHNCLPIQAVNSLWLIYDDSPSYVSRVLAFQTSLPEDIVDDLVSRIRVDSARGLKTENHLTALRRCNVPEDILEHAVDALALHEETPPHHLLAFFIDQEKLRPKIFNTLVARVLSMKHPWLYLEDICAKHGGLERLMIEAEEHIWKSLFEAIYATRQGNNKLCFIQQNCLHIKFRKLSIQVSIEADEQRQKLQSGIDHIHELTHSLVGASEEERNILSLMENLTLDPES